MAGYIRELPQDTRDQLRSTFIIQTLPSCIVELVHNALDADARSIQIAVSVANWECRVSDNGTGIDSRNLALLGKRYYTSKHAQVQTSNASGPYGYRGEALASIADMSLVEIITRHTSSTESSTAILKGGKSLYVGPSKHGHLPSGGTTVIVRDLFYKWPVRRKQAESSESLQRSTLAQIKKHLEALAIINHHVAFQLYDLDKEDSPTAGLILQTTSTTSILNRIASLYGRHLVKETHCIDLEGVNLAVRGFIALTSTHSKQVQYIFVNRRDVNDTPLHRQINHLFERSAFARRAEVDARQAEREVSPRPAPFLRKTESPKKHINRFPVFCIGIEIPREEVEFAFEPSKQIAHFQNETAIKAAIEGIVVGFLRKYGFIDAQDKANTSPLRPVSSPVGQRVKRIKSLKLLPQPHYAPDLPMIHDQLSKPMADRLRDSVPEVVAAVTGSSLPPADTGSTSSTSRATQREEQHIDVRHLRRSDKSEEALEKPAWLQNVLKNWENPVYPPASKAIRSLQAQPMPRLDQDHVDGAYDTPQYRLDKEMLHWCTFVSQIDYKFLLFTCSGDDGPTSLLLVDQHAADERIRVEHFLRNLGQQLQDGSVETLGLATQKAILLTAREVSDLRRHMAWLARWGFTIGISDVQANDPDFVQVHVKTVPSMLGERLAAEDRLLRTVIQGLLSHAQEKGTRVASSRNSSCATVLRNMPDVLLDLVNSKACRGAIMFNDQLADSRCQKLVSQLADCDFPFICAHGRPSMVPLLKLPDIERVQNKRAKLDWQKVRQLSDAM